MMSYILQIIGSIFLGGIIFLLILKLNFGISNASAVNSIEASTQSAAASLDEVLQTELSLIGYGETNIASHPLVKSIIDSTGIEFISDVNNDGKVEKVKYYTDLTKITATENPNDINFKRVVDGTSSDIGVGVTRFVIHCYDSKGMLTSIPSSVATVRYDFTVQSLSSYYDELTNKRIYASTSISRLIKPKNFK
jgi:hypothetical protein